MQDIKYKNGVPYKLGADGLYHKVAAPAGAQQGVIGTIPGRVDPYKERDQEIQEGNFNRGERADSRDAAVQPFREREARAKAIKAERDLNTPDPEVAKRRAVNSGQLSDLGNVAQQLNRVQELYNKDLKGGGLGKGVGQLLPNEKMARFQSQANALAVFMKPLVRGPGEGPFTDKDQAILDRLVPSRYTYDADNEERIDAAKRFIEQRVKKHGGRARREPIGRRRDRGFQILGYE